MNCPDPVHNLLVQNPNLLLSCTSIENNQQQQQQQQQQQIEMNPTYDHCYSMQQSTGSHESSSSSFDLADSLITAAITNDMSGVVGGVAPPPSIERQFSFDQFIQQDESVSLESQREIRDEILDLNIFELLANEEPEMARLIDQASSLDPYGLGGLVGSGSAGGNFLPQISVNTTSKILDSLSTSLGNHHHHHHHHHGYGGLSGGAAMVAMPKTHSSSSLSSVLYELSTKSSSISEETANTTTTSVGGTKPTIFKLEDLADEIPSHQNYSQGNNNLMMHASPSFKELCELLSMKKVNSSSSSSIASQSGGSNQPAAARNRQVKLLNPPSVDESSSKLSASAGSAAAGLKPSRTSMRLFQKRNIKKEPMDVEEEMLVQTTTTTSNKRRAATASNVRNSTTSRKQKSDSMEDTSSSEESDDKSSSSSDSKPAFNSSNENSMDLTSFYESTKQNDNDEENQDSESDDDDDDDEMDSDDSSSENFSGKQQRRLSGRKSSSSGGSVCLGGGLNGMNHHLPIKKESNKEAATRYRLKKLSEKDKLFETRFNLEKENDSKRRQIELVQAEINYLKTILVQFILTKSCLNTNTQPPNSTATSI